MMNSFHMYDREMFLVELGMAISDDMHNRDGLEEDIEIGEFCHHLWCFIWDWLAEKQRDEEYARILFYQDYFQYY